MTILIAFGGESWEREGSFFSATEVARSLDRLNIRNKMVEFDLGICSLFSQATFVFNCVHGRGGEDGALSALCEIASIPYNFSGALAHATAFNKLQMKMAAHEHGVRVPRVLDGACDAKRYASIPRGHQNEASQWILKPIFGGGSKGTKVFSSVADFEQINEARETKYDPYFVEEFIKGTFVTCVSTGDADFDATLPILEVSFAGEIFDYEQKIDSKLRQYHIPARISSVTKSDIRRDSISLYNGIGNKGMVRYDYIVDSDNNHWLLEANTIPGLSKEGIMAAIWSSSGREFDNMIAFLAQRDEVGKYKF